MVGAVSTLPGLEHFAKFGPVEIVPLSKVQRLTGAYLTRSAQHIPHVTHQDEVDTTALERRRRSFATLFPGQKITSLAFHMKAVARALAAFPRFNASLDEASGHLVLKKYCNIGVAIDTPRGLVVGVVTGVDGKSIGEIADDIDRLAAKARSKGLAIDDMSGGCFTISSLGRNGGTGFTPIINAPEVAILGVSGLQERPVRDGNDIAWRQMLPLSLSYDHRVINGVEAAAFVRYLGVLLAEEGSEYGLAGPAESDA